MKTPAVPMHLGLVLVAPLLATCTSQIDREAPRAEPSALTPKAQEDDMHESTQPGSGARAAKQTRDGRLILPSPEAIAALPADGGPEFNRLIHAQSPYLLQHARNPVDWHPWGDEAFELARRLDRPIFLSIGYSTCHWCHVMEHESFEDVDVAKLMNAAFVCIKVDREERPDVDQVYMSVVQAVTGRGGWPMTVVMTPDREPFFVDTYLPKSSRPGRIGMLELVPRIVEAWRDRRAEIDEGASQLVERVSASAASAIAGTADMALVERGVEQLKSIYDERFGGFGQPPKFPVPHNLRLLLRFGAARGDSEALEMVRTTLHAMRRGGMYDHVGFGFHRYSTDERWFLPHFEKMLYDQALHCLAYTEAFQVLGEPKFEATAREICEYVLRDLTSPEGGFYSAEDADSEGEEGLFYLWRPEEVVLALGADDGVRVNEWFGVEADGNFREEATGQRTGESILHLERELDADVAQQTWPALRAKLFAARELRVHPLRDDKVLSDWNGLMIAALAQAGAAFDEPRYTQAATRAADFATTKLVAADDGRLLKRWRAGHAGIDGLLEDHAFLVLGLIELFEATGEARWIVAARNFTDRAVARFWDEEAGGFFTAPPAAPDLVFASKEVYDGALPSGNSVMAENLLRLARIVGEPSYEERGHALLTALAGDVARFPGGHSQFLLATCFASGTTYEVVVAGAPEDPLTAEALRALRAAYLPHVVLVERGSGERGEATANAVPYARAMAPSGAGPALYVCSDFTCDAPTCDLALVLAKLALGPQ